MAKNERWISYMAKGPIRTDSSAEFKDDTHKDFVKFECPTVGDIREDYIAFLDSVYEHTVGEAQQQYNIAQTVLSEEELQAFIDEFFKPNSSIQYLNDFLKENEKDLTKTLQAGKTYRKIATSTNVQTNSSGQVITPDSIELSDIRKLQGQINNMCMEIKTKLDIINRILLDAQKTGAKIEDLTAVKEKLKALEQGLLQEKNSNGLAGILHDSKGQQKYSTMTSLQNIYKAPMGKAWEEVLVIAINSLDFFKQKSEGQIIKSIQATAKGGNLEKPDIDFILNDNKNQKISIPVSLKIADYENRTQKNNQATMYTGFHGFMPMKNVFDYLHSIRRSMNKSQEVIFKRLLTGELYHQQKTGKNIAFSRFKNAIKLKEAFQRALAAGVIGSTHTGVLAPRMEKSENDVVYLSFGKTFVSKYTFLNKLRNAKGFAYTPIKNDLNISSSKSIGGVAAYRGGITPFRLRDGSSTLFNKEFKTLSNLAFQQAGFSAYAFKMNKIKLK